MRKLWIFISVVLIAIVGIILIATHTKKEPEIIQIGAILPLTGGDAKLGESAKKGIELAVRQINDTEGLQKGKLVVLYQDSQGESTKAISAFRKLIISDKVPVVIGELASTVTLALSPIAEENHIILLSPTASSPKISDAGDYVFRICASDIFEASFMAEFAYNELKYSNIAILYINNDYGVGLKESFQKHFSGLGGSVLAVEAFEQGATDFKTQLVKIKSKNVQAIYMPGYAAEMGIILRQSKELGTNIQFLSSIAMEDPQVIEIAKDAANGVIYTAYGYDPKRELPVIQEFVKAFRIAYGEEPDIYAALSYDAVKVIAFALEKAREAVSNEIKNQLYIIKDYPGVTGNITFDDKGDVTKSITIKVIKNGTFKYY